MVTTEMTGWMQRPFVALGMLAIAMAMIPLNDALIKLMSAYMPLAVIWAIVIWDDWPDGLSWLGMGLILCGGLYTIWRERAREVEVMTSTPMPASASAAQAAEREADSEPRS